MSSLHDQLCFPARPYSPDFSREVFETLVNLPNPFELLLYQPHLRSIFTPQLELFLSRPVPQRFFGYAVLLAAYGTIDSLRSFRLRRKVILGFRKETSTKANQGKGVYDDWFVVLDPGTGNHPGTVKEFQGNTEPAYRYDANTSATKKHLGKDVDGDGVIDLGRIPEGTYRFKKSTSTKYGNILAPVSKIRLERDTNHDGRFDQNDTVSPKLSANEYATDTFFHKGGRGGFTGSAGCQTLEPETFELFWAVLGSQSEFHYVLIRS